MLKRKSNAYYGMYYWWMRRDLIHIWEHQWLNPILRRFLKAAINFINKHYSEDIEAYLELPEPQP